MRSGLLGLACAGWLLAVGASHALAQSKPATPRHEFQVPAELVINEGESEELALAIVPSEGFRVDANGPLRIDLRLASETKLAIKKRRLRHRDATSKGGATSRFSVAVRGRRPGHETLEIAYRFWLCRAKICWPVRGVASLNVEVLAPPVAEVGADDAGPQPNSPL